MEIAECIGTMVRLDQGMNAKQANGKTHFERPKLNEVICGVAFAGVTWSEVHYGLLFNEVKDSFENHRRATRIEWPPIKGPMLVQEAPFPRIIFESERNPFLLQVQDDKFYVNWRLLNDEHPYPHFNPETKTGLLHKFLVEWDRFTKFCTRYEIGTPTVCGYDLTYTNHLYQQDDWATEVDLAELLTLLSPLKQLKQVNGGQVSFNFESGGIPIRVTAKFGKRIQDKRRVLVLELSSQQMSNANLTEWFNKANSSLVSEFLALTTDRARKEWGYTP